MVTLISKEQVLEQIESLPPDRLAEVARFIEFLQFQAGKEAAPRSVSEDQAAFGIWADYGEAQDPAGFARKLRQQVEYR